MVWTRFPGAKPIHQIASENEIHPVQVSQWKKELQGRISELFERKNGRSKEAEKEQRHIEQLERKVGQLILTGESSCCCRSPGVDLGAFSWKTPSCGTSDSIEKSVQAQDPSQAQ